MMYKELKWQRVSPENDLWATQFASVHHASGYDGAEYAITKSKRTHMYDIRMSNRANALGPFFKLSEAKASCDAINRREIQRHATLIEAWTA